MFSHRTGVSTQQTGGESVTSHHCEKVKSEKEDEEEEDGIGDVFVSELDNSVALS